MTKEQFLQKYGGADKTATVGVVVAAVDELMMPKMLEAFDQVLLPAFTQLLAQQESRLKDYIDRKLTDHTAELFKRLDEKWQKEKQFKDRVIDLFKRHNIGSKEDIAFLEGLAY